MNESKVAEVTLMRYVENGGGRSLRVIGGAEPVGIAIEVGGTVIVKTITEWHKLAAPPAVSDAPKEPDATPAEAVVAARSGVTAGETALQPDAPPMQGDDAELCNKLRGACEWPPSETTSWRGLCTEAAARIEQLSAQDYNWRRWGIIEVAIRNPNVSSYMDHWEKRTLAAESLVAQQKERIAELNKLIARAEWAQSGYCPWCAGWEVERNRGCKPKVHRKDCPAIDAALAADPRSTKHQLGETK